MKDLRIAFMGTPEFAVASLDCLVQANKNIVAVITAPDKKAGRGQKIQTSALKDYALEKGITLLQPTNLKDPEFLKELKDLKIDLQIVVAFRMLPESVWNMPPLGTFNLHASLLPKYRGAAPINWAIIKGEKETGISTFFLQHEIDTGDLLFQEKVSIEDSDTAGSLHDKLMSKGAELVLKTVLAIENGTTTGTPQKQLNSNELERFKAPKLFRDQCEINWSLPPRELDCFIRGLSPYPAAWTRIKHKTSQKTLRLKVFSIAIANENEQNDQFILEEGKKLWIQSSKGKYELTSVQLEGKKRMDMQSLLNGTNFMDYELV